MHIPDGILNIPVASTGYLVAGLAGAWSSRAARRDMDERLVPTAGVAGAFVFAAQMVQIPIPLVGATSGHLVGGALMAMLLGLPAAVLVMSAVLVVQCFLFQDGGLIALGANITNMAVIGPFVGWSVMRLVRPQTKVTLALAAFVGGWLSLTLAGLAAGIEVGLSTSIPTAKAAWGMGIVHAAIGLLEGGVTAAVVLSLAARKDVHIAALPAAEQKADNGQEDLRNGKRAKPAGPWPRWVLIALGGVSILCGLVLAQFSSSLPDGLESFLEHFGISGGDHLVPSFMPDYQVTWLMGWPGRVLAAMLGLVGTAVLAAAFFRSLRIGGKDKDTGRHETGATQ